MALAAGSLNTRCTVRRSSPAGETDDWGVPLPPTATEFHLWADVKAPTGAGAIRDGLSSGMPLSTARYSLRVRLSAAQRVQVGDRIQAGPLLDLRVEGIVPDVKSRTTGYILCTHDGTKEA